MSANISPQPTAPTESDVWEPPMPPDDLIFDDGEPLESNRHRLAMNVLIDSLYRAWSERDDFFAGGNMFVYYSRTQARNRDFRGPDFFVVLDVDGNQSRQGWVVWDENGRYPDVIVELMSPSTASVDLGAKKDLYERIFRTRNYFAFDPFDPSSLQGWKLDNAFRYQPIPPNESGWLWSDVLQLWLGTWDGTLMRETATWLRFYDTEGNLLLLPVEAEQAERQRAESERQRAESERQRAESERQRAESERQRADRLAEKLRELGEDPETG